MIGTSVQPLNEARAALEAASTPVEAAGLANYAAAWQAAVKAANYSFEVQQEAAELRLRAERRLGQLLADTVTPGSRYDVGAQLPEGVERWRSSRAQKLARVTDDDLESYLANTLAAGKDITITGAMKLLPTTERPPSASVGSVYTAPPIDIELARREGLDAADTRAELFVAAIHDALTELGEQNASHALIWAKHHGINDDGTIGDAWTFAAIAAQLGVTREVVAARYYRASTFVFQRVVVAMMNRIAALMAAA